jgi:hypothetical protein
MVIKSSSFQLRRNRIDPLYEINQAQKPYNHIVYDRKTGRKPKHGNPYD